MGETLVALAVVVMLVAAIGCLVVFAMRVVRTGRRGVRLVRLAGRARRVQTSPDAPVTGELAHALACGAHLAVVNGQPWNTLREELADPEEGRSRLRDMWGVTSHERWRETVDSLVAEDRGSNWAANVALEVRRRYGVETGFLPDQDAWRMSIMDVARGNDMAETTIAELLAAARRVVELEARLREDGVLPHAEVVHTARAYDFGRAPNVARWGLTAGYCDEGQARRAVLHAGRMARSRYRSWDVFSAAYILGRVLHFDDDESGPMYTTALDSHRILTGDTTSPWRTLPWDEPAPIERSRR